MNSIRSQVLKELVTEWKLSDDGSKKKSVAFKKILSRVDRLLIDRVMKLKRTRRGLERVENQDLYQSAIIGLYRGINSAKDKDSGDTIQARILSYINEEIKKHWLGKRHRMPLVDPQEVSRLGYCEDPDPQIESDEILNKVFEMVSNGELPKDDFEMLIEWAIHKRTYSDIGKSRGIRYGVVSKKIKALKREIVKRLNLQDDW